MDLDDMGVSKLSATVF